MHEAAEDGDGERLALLLAEDPDQIDETDYGNDWVPLHYAVQNNHGHIVEQLLLARASVDKFDPLGCSPLHLAANEGHHEIMEQLLKVSSLALINAVNAGATALQLAAEKGHEKVVVQLLTARASVHKLARRSLDTALHHAASGGHQSVVALLLDAKATVDPRDDAGCTPLHLAAAEGHIEVEEQLLAAGASIDAVDSQGFTPLHHAVVNGFSTNAVKLLTIKPDLVFARDSSGNTLLHLALFECDDTFIKLLYERNPHALQCLNTSMNSPFFFAVQNARIHAAELMHGGLSYDEIVHTFGACGYHDLPWYRPVMERYCEPLLVFLNRDVTGVVFEYLGFEREAHGSRALGSDLFDDGALEHAVNNNSGSEFGDDESSEAGTSAKRQKTTE